MTATSLPRLVRSLSRQYGPRPVLLQEVSGDRVEYSWCDLWTGAVEVARALAPLNLPDEARVVILAPTSAASIAAEVGVMAIRAVACPLDPSLEDGFLEARITEASAGVVLTSADQVDRIQRCLQKIGLPARLLLLPDVRPGATSQPELDAEIEARLNSTGPGGHAVSLPGREGDGALVDFLHGTLTETAAALAAALHAGEGDTWFSPGPFVAPWARVAGLYAGLVSGGEVALAIPGRDRDPLAPFWVLRPTVAVLTRPQLSALAARAREEASALTGLPGWLARVALRWEGALGADSGPLPRRVWWREAARAGRARLRDLWGGRLRLVLTEGGPPDAATACLLRGMDILVCGSFGPQEVAGLLAVERPVEETPPGSVGRALDGMRIETAEDGEILASGHAVMLSYRKVRPDQNPRFRDGFLRCGVRGRVDRGGWVFPEGFFDAPDRMGP